MTGSQKQYKKTQDIQDSIKQINESRYTTVKNQLLLKN